MAGSALFTTLVDDAESGRQVGVRWSGPLPTAPELAGGSMIEVEGTIRVEGATWMVVIDSYETAF